MAELRAALGSLPHTRVGEIRDEAGRDIVRVAVSPDSAALGFSAADLARWLAEGQPAVMVRAHRAAAGTIALDPRPLSREDVPVLVEAIRAVYRKHAAG